MAPRRTQKERSQTTTAALVEAARRLFAAFTGWAFYTSEGLSGGWESLGAILPMVIAGLVVVGGLTGVLMWLAFYSSRHGYDEPFDVED